MFSTNIQNGYKVISVFLAYLVLFNLVNTTTTELIALMFKLFQKHNFHIEDCIYLHEYFQKSLKSQSTSSVRLLQNILKSCAFILSALLETM